MDFLLTSIGKVVSARLDNEIFHSYYSKRTKTHMKEQEVYERYIELIQRIVHGLPDTVRISIDDTPILGVIAELCCDKSSLRLPVRLHHFPLSLHCHCSSRRCPRRRVF